MGAGRRNSGRFRQVVCGGDVQGLHSRQFGSLELRVGAFCQAGHTGGLRGLRTAEESHGEQEKTGRPLPGEGPADHGRRAPIPQTRAFSPQRCFGSNSVSLWSLEKKPLHLASQETRRAQGSKARSCLTPKMHHSPWLESVPLKARRAPGLRLPKEEQLGYSRSRVCSRGGLACSNPQAPA